MVVWHYPEGGSFAAAVPGDEDVAPAVEKFFGRELSRYNHAVYWELKPDLVFFFAEKSDAEKRIAEFKAEWFDPRDKGRGQHWGKWYRGKTAKRLANRSPYDFRCVEAPKFHWALRKYMKDHRVLRKTYEEMPPDPEQPGDEPRNKWAVCREANFQEQATDYLRSKYLVELAYRYHVPIPWGEDNWLQPRGTPEQYLTPEAAHKLRSDIRIEQKAAWEFWQTRVTFALALIGSIFSVLAYFKK